MKASYITPAITVMDSQGNLDLEGQGELYDHLIDGGIDGILILGSIGEFFALTLEQKKELVEFAVGHVNKRVKLIVGTASMVIQEIIDLSKYALEKGADAVMVIPPYYFWLKDAGVEAYYDKIADAINGDIYLYNFPDRTGYDISPEVVLKLCRKHSNIVGLKDTLSGVDHTREVIKLVKPEFPEFEIYSGFDDNFAHNVLAGGDGCIGGLSNVVPELFHDWVASARDEDMDKFAKIQQKVNRLMSIYAVGAPFVPFIKAGVSLRKKNISSYASFPLPVASEKDKEIIAQIMKDNKIL